MKEFERTPFLFKLPEDFKDDPVYRLRFFVPQTVQQNASTHNKFDYDEMIEKVAGDEIYNVVFRRKVTLKGESKHICVIKIDEDQYIEMAMDKDDKYRGYNVYKLGFSEQNLLDRLNKDHLVEVQANIDFVVSLDEYQSYSNLIELCLKLDTITSSPDPIDKEKERRIWDKYVQAYGLLLENKKQVVKARVFGLEGDSMKVRLVKEGDNDLIRQAFEKIHETEFSIDFEEERIIIRYEKYQNFTDLRLQRIQKQLSPIFLDIDGHKNVLKLDFKLLETPQEKKEKLIKSFGDVVGSLIKCTVEPTTGNIHNLKLKDVDRFDKILSNNKFSKLKRGAFRQVLHFFRPPNYRKVLTKINDYVRTNSRVRKGVFAKLDNHTGLFTLQSFDANIIRDLEAEFSGLKHTKTIAEYKIILGKGDKIKKSLSDIKLYKNDLYHVEIKSGSDFKKYNNQLRRAFPNSKVISRDSFFSFEYNSPPIDEDTLTDLKIEMFEYIQDHEALDEKGGTIDLSFDSLDEHQKRYEAIEAIMKEHKIKLFNDDNISVGIITMNGLLDESEHLFSKLENELKNQDGIKLPNDFSYEEDRVGIEYEFENEEERELIVDLLKKIGDKYSEQLDLNFSNELGETIIIATKDLEKEESAEEQAYNKLMDADFKYETSEGKEKYDKIREEKLSAEAEIREIMKTKRSVPEDYFDKLYETKRNGIKKLSNEWDKDFGRFHRRKKDRYGRPYILVEPSNKVNPNKLMHELIFVLPSFRGEEAIIKRMEIAMNKIVRPSKYTGFPKNDRIRNFLFDPFYAREISKPDTSITSEEYQEFLQTRIEQNLNKKQEEAVLKALKTEDLMLLQGPPGTGKTTAISEMLWQIICKNQESITLVSSQSNLAVDNALDRLPRVGIVRPIRIGGSRISVYVNDGEGGKTYSREKTIEKKIAYAERFEEGFKYAQVILEIWQDEEPGSNYEKETQSNVVAEWITRIKNKIELNQKAEPQFSDVLDKWKQKFVSPKKDIKSFFTSRYIKYRNIVAATCMECGTLDFNEEFKNGFDYVIVDEASKATPPELILPLTYGKASIIIGDHKQLPPMIEERQLEEALEDVGAGELVKELGTDIFKKSQFERLFEQAKNTKPSLVTELDTQYRMHKDIMAVINQFYTDIENSKGGHGLICGLDDTKMNLPFDYLNQNGEIEKASRDHGLDYGFLSPEDHVIWVDVKTPEIRKGTSYYNQGEINAIAKILKAIKSAPKFNAFQDAWEKEEEKEVGVITFYGAQLKKIKKLASAIKREDGRKKNYYNGIPIRIATVDKFQGMERNILIVSTVRSDYRQKEGQQDPEKKKRNKALGFATDPKRINVAFSRARRLLIIVGNKDHFDTSDLYKEVIKTINKQGKVISEKEL